MECITCDKMVDDHTQTEIKDCLQEWRMAGSPVDEGDGYTTEFERAVDLGGGAQ